MSQAMGFMMVFRDPQLWDLLSLNYFLKQQKGTFLTAMFAGAVLQSTLSICFHCCSFGSLVPKWATIEYFVMF